VQNGILLPALSIPVPYCHSIQFIPTQHKNALEYEHSLRGDNTHRRSAAQHICDTQRKITNTYTLTRSSSKEPTDTYDSLKNMFPFFQKSEILY